MTVRKYEKSFLIILRHAVQLLQILTEMINFLVFQVEWKNKGMQMFFEFPGFIHVTSIW